MASTAHHGHEQVFDTDVQVERRRADKALHMRIQPARQRGQQGRQHKELDAVARSVDTHGFRHDLAALERANRSAFPRIQQVVEQPHGQQHHHPDHHTNRARRRQIKPRDLDGRNAGQAGLAAQKLHIAEQVVQTQAPGNRAQWQIVALQLHRDRAQHPGHDEGDDKAQQQAQPGQGLSPKDATQGVRCHRRCTDPGRGVGSHAHKGRLTKRSHTAHTRQHH